jgi:hypothetical protein
MFYGRDLYYLLLFPVPGAQASQPPNLERKFLVTRPHSSSQIGIVSPGAGKVAPFNSRTATGIVSIL